MVTYFLLESGEFLWDTDSLRLRTQILELQSVLICFHFENCQCPVFYNKDGSLALRVVYGLGSQGWQAWAGGGELNRTWGALGPVGSATLIAMVSMAWVTACAPVPATAPPVSEHATPTPTPQPAPTQPILTHTPHVSPTHQAPGKTVAPSPSGPISPIATPTPAGDETPEELAPGFSLDSAQGSAVTLSDYRGQSNVVLVFYRGQT
ncbi:MAG: hypothetical protein JSV81_02550 [Anaerolineales bacterium]|nr:MAG: hypothetical protein JSV81_02550 [Anaerolineales bacterium]